MQHIEVRVRGRIDPQWSEWFHDLAVAHREEEDETVLSGTVADQAALYGLLARLRDIGLELVSVASTEVEPDPRGPRRRRSARRPRQGGTGQE